MKSSAAGKEKARCRLFPKHRFQGFFTFPVVLSFLILAATKQGNAQLLYGSIVGTVTDNGGSVLPGATVKVKQTQTGETRSAVTNDSGAYIISTVPSGTYDVSVSKSGFKLFDAANVAVLINTTVRVDASLNVGAETQTVNVSAEAAVLQTDRPDVHGSDVRGLGATATTYKNISRFGSAAARSTAAERQFGRHQQPNTVHDHSGQWHQRPAAETQCPGSVASVPFRFVNGPQIVLAVSINHTGPYNFLLDSGTQSTMIDLSLAAALHVDTQGAAEVAGVGSRNSASLAQVDLIEVGAYAVANQKVLVYDLDNLDSADLHLQGILGDDFLEHFDLLIDNATRLLCLDNSATMRAEVKGPRIPLLARAEADGGGLLIITARLSAGLRPVHLLLDSGANVADPIQHL